MSFLIRFQSLVIILCGSQLHPLRHPSFFIKSSTSLQPSSFIILFPASSILGVQESLFVLYSPSLLVCAGSFPAKIIFLKGEKLCPSSYTSSNIKKATVDFTRFYSIRQKPHSQIWDKHGLLLRQLRGDTQFLEFLWFD